MKRSFTKTALFAGMALATIIAFQALAGSAAFAQSSKNQAGGVPALNARVTAVEQGLENIQLTPGPQGETGPQGPQGEPGTDGETGATGATGTFSAPVVTDAIFGTGTKTHFVASNWVLEALDASTLQIRATASGFFRVGMTHPTNCSGLASTLATADMAQRHRFMTSSGQTLNADLCSEGSTMFIQIDDGFDAGYFRCWRLSGNANSCQRLLP